MTHMFTAISYAVPTRQQRSGPFESSWNQLQGICDVSRLAYIDACSQQKPCSASICPTASKTPDSFLKNVNVRFQIFVRKQTCKKDLKVHNTSEWFSVANGSLLALVIRDRTIHTVECPAITFSAIGLSYQMTRKSAASCALTTGLS